MEQHHNSSPFPLSRHTPHYRLFRKTYFPSTDSISDIVLMTSSTSSSRIVVRQAVRLMVRTISLTLAGIRRLLTANRPNANARFVDMQLSATGLQVSRS